MTLCGVWQSDSANYKTVGIVGYSVSKSTRHCADDFIP